MRSCTGSRFRRSNINLYQIKVNFMNYTPINELLKPLGGGIAERILSMVIKTVAAHRQAGAAVPGSFTALIVDRRPPLPAQGPSPFVTVMATEDSAPSLPFVTAAMRGVWPTLLRDCPVGRVWVLVDTVEARGYGCMRIALQRG